MKALITPCARVQRGGKFAAHIDPPIRASTWPSSPGPAYSGKKQTFCHVSLAMTDPNAFRPRLALQHSYHAHASVAEHVNSLLSSCKVQVILNRFELIMTVPCKTRPTAAACAVGSQCVCFFRGLIQFRTRLSKQWLYEASLLGIMVSAVSRCLHLAMPVKPL